MVDGTWVENTTCKRCRHRHPATIDCAEAKLLACKAAAERADARTEEQPEDRLAELKAAGEQGADLSPGDPLCAWAAKEIDRLREYEWMYKSLNK